MNCFERFKKKMELCGGSLREERIISSRNLVEAVFQDDAAIVKGIYFWKLNLTSYDKECEIGIRFYNRKFSQANGDLVNFQTLMSTPIVVGDVLYDGVNKEYWICTESFNIDNIHYQGKLTKCNWILKWQLEDGTIVSYPCQDMNSTQYNSGETPNRLYTIASSQHLLTLPCDENTVELCSPMRFYLTKSKKNPITYIVSQNDTTSYNYGKGLCKVTVTEHPKDSVNDRPDLGICDYREVGQVENTTTSQIVYETLSIKSGGDSQTFKAKFFNSDGSEMNGVTPKWEIICDFKDKLEVIESGNEIRIGIDNDDYIDEEFSLVLTDITDNNQSNLIIKIDSIL